MFQGSHPNGSPHLQSFARSAGHDTRGTRIHRTSPASARIQPAAFSAIISVGLLVLPLVMVGMALASTTRSCRT